MSEQKNYLEMIKTPADVKSLSDQELTELASQVRKTLIETVAENGGHLSSNLGAVELTVAMHRVFDLEQDQIVFDVGHQCYTHKLLTGRYDRFHTLRRLDGMSGFPSPKESPYDVFIAGHSSTAVSAANGLAKAKSLLGEEGHVLAVVGDGAMTGGLFYEGLSNAGRSHDKLIIIMNDNRMSINGNVGFVARHLSRMRSRPRYVRFKRNFGSGLRKIPLVGKPTFRLLMGIKTILKDKLYRSSSMFEDMGYYYLGPVDGHDLPNLINLLTTARDLNEPVLLHVLTKKGAGYSFAEEDPAKFHGIGKFDPATGKKLAPKVKTYSDSFGETLCDLARSDNRVCAITAAMPGGTGLLGFMKEFPERLFDVGIAEEHAISMAGGLAKQGMIPVVALYSTFLQRGYDQILQDVAMLKLHVVFAIDRAGLVGEDGETHHGVFDVGFLRQIPGMMVLCPASCRELSDALHWAVKTHNGPVAIRYPRGGDDLLTESGFTSHGQIGTDGLLYRHRKGEHAVLISYGSMTNQVLRSAQILSDKGIEVTVLQLLTVAPLPMKDIVGHLKDCRHVFVVEEACTGSGIADALHNRLLDYNKDIRFHTMDLGREFVSHGSIAQLYRQHGLDGESIANAVLEVLQNEN